MISEGLTLMGFGMGVVFIFLIIMIIVMYFSSAIIGLINKIIPEKVEKIEHKLQKAIESNDDIALVVAVVKSHIK